MLRSLRVQQTIFTLAVALVPLVIVTIIVATQSFSNLEDEAVARQEQEAGLAASEIGGFIQARLVQLALLTDVRRISELDSAEQTNLLSTLLAYDSAYSELSLLDGDGHEVLRINRNRAYPETELIDRSSDAVFLQPVQTQQTYFSSIRFDNTLREPLFTIAKPIIDLVSGDVEYVLVAEFRFRPIWELIGTLQGDDENTDIYVIDSNGQLIAHSNPSLILAGRSISPPAENGRSEGLLNEDVILATQGLQYGGQQLIVVAERDYDDALSLANSIVSISLAVVLITIFSLLLIVPLFVLQITNPIARLSATAQKISAGNLSARAEIFGPNEVRELARSFNSMTNQLQDSINTLEQRVRDRTRDLHIASDVARQLTRELDVNTLLPKLVEQTRAAFNLYHVSVLLFDETQGELVLAAASGEIGDQMLSQDHRLNLSDKSLVTRAAISRKLVIVPDVTTDTDYRAVEYLPDTRAEISVPMQMGDILLGVIDLQARNPISQEEIEVLVTLSEQITIAVRNARLYSEAQAARANAEEANKVKSQFLANMSHELRTPLNAILNFTGFVADGVMGPVNERQVQTLNQSIASGKHLLALINDILDITKIEAGMMDLFIQEVDLNEIIGAAVSIGRGLVKDKPIKFLDDVESNLPVTFGDKRRLRQVMLNMISNAVKFTPQGRVVVKAYHENDTIRISVSDTGIGIAPDDQGLVFESFKQAKHNLQEAIGTGLGMPISKYFVESHGGRIWLESEVGTGTTFFVELPVLSEDKAQTLASTLVTATTG